MGERERLGRDFGWLWSASTASALGSSFALGALPLIAVRVLHASTAQVSALPAVGTAAGAACAVALGPWAERRRRRPVMVAMDLIRFLVMASIPLAYALGRVSLAQLLAASVVAAGAKIAFGAASGASLRSLVPRDKLMTANARLASANWLTVTVGPPLGGAAIALLGPVTTVTADAVSYLLSARARDLAIRTSGPVTPAARPPPAVAPGELAAGWRLLLADPVLRRLMVNGVLTGALILATEPLLAVLLLRQLRFTTVDVRDGLRAPRAGGFVASRLAPRLTAQYGPQRMLLVAGTAPRLLFPVGLALTFVPASAAWRTSSSFPDRADHVFMGLYTPVYATCRLGARCPRATSPAP